MIPAYVLLKIKIKLFNWVKHFRFGKSRTKSIRFSISGFDCSPALCLYVDPGDREYRLHIAFFIGIWISLERIMPKSWYPADYDERQLGIQFHHGNLWWNLFMKVNEWNSKDPKWRRGSTSFSSWIKGKHSVEWTNGDRRMFILPFLEGNYSIEVIQKHRIDRWQRWFTSKSWGWEVRPGYYTGHNNTGDFISVPIPHLGKGENSYDCGETGTYSSNFPSDRGKTHEKAAMYFWQHCMEDRIKYSTFKWTPAKHRNAEISFFKENQITD